MSKLWIPTEPEKKHQIAQWAAEQIPWFANLGAAVFGPCEAWAILKDGDDGKPKLMGAMIFNNWRPEVGDIEWNVISLEEGWASANVFRTAADYVFNQLGCNRVSVTLPRGARKYRAHAKQMGFREEGIKRRGFANGVDAVLYGMLKEDCTFLDHEKAAA